MEPLLFKGAHSVPHALSPSAEAVIGKDPGSDPLANLSLPERQEAAEIFPGNIDTGGSHFWSLFYHEDTGADKHHFRILPLTY